MMSDEALVGMRVRVRESIAQADLSGIEGAIAGRCGSPDYLALDVLLDDGRTQLFWHRELEEIKSLEKGVPRPRSAQQGPGIIVSCGSAPDVV
jgi:hypothetical protein